MRFRRIDPRLVRDAVLSGREIIVEYSDDGRVFRAVLDQPKPKTKASA